MILTQDPEQLVVPPGQLVVQAPPEQTWFALHCLPQAPQLKKSLVLFTHLSPHLVNPASQLTPQLVVCHPDVAKIAATRHDDVDQTDYDGRDAQGKQHGVNQCLEQGRRTERQSARPNPKAQDERAEHNSHSA